MPRPVHFEFQADDPERAVQFYSEVFGWEFNNWGGPQEYWLITTGAEGQPGINGGMMRRQPEWAGNTCNILDVPSVDDFAEKITGAGGTIVMPKFAVPGIGWVAYFKDTEGTFCGMMESDAEAK